MGRVLPDLIKNRVRFGFIKKKKKLKAGPGWVRLLVKTQPELDLISLNVKLQKTLPIYIYHNPNPKTHFSLNSVASLTSPSLTLTLTIIHISSTPHWFSLSLTSHPHPHSHWLTNSPSPSWRSTDLVVVVVCHGGAWDCYIRERCDRVVRSEHRIDRLERDVMIGGVFGHVEVRWSLGVGLMAEITANGALVVWVLHFFFFGSFPLSSFCFWVFVWGFNMYRM